MSYDNVMLDLETMGIGPYSAIVSIGAVEFDLKSNTLGREFYSAVDLTSSVSSGGVIDACTVLWWLNQSNQARKAITEKTTTLPLALSAFSDWLKGYNTSSNTTNIRVWGNGSDFDNVILSNAYKNTGQAVPWRYSNNRCYRTVVDMYPTTDIDRVGVHHNALDDARSQALHLIKLMGGQT